MAVIEAPLGTTSIRGPVAIVCSHALAQLLVLSPLQASNTTPPQPTAQIANTARDTMPPMYHGGDRRD